MGKLGLHVNTIQPSIRRLIVEGRPAVVKSLQHDGAFWREMKAASPGTLLVGRIFLPESEQRLDDPAGRARALAPRLVQIARSCGYDVVEGYNEVGVNTPDEAKRYNEFTVVLAGELHQAGVRLAAYSFATGNPEPGMWRYLLDGLRSSDFLALHEYSAPRMTSNAGWLCLRYRQLYAGILPADCRWPLVITECGIDGGVIGQVNHGWQAFVSAEDYAVDLAWYDREITQDSYVVGATIFCQGTPDATWRSFEVLGTPVEGLLLEYWKRVPAVTWRPGPVVRPQPQPTPGQGLPLSAAKGGGIMLEPFPPDYARAVVHPAHQANAGGPFQVKPWVIVLHGTGGPFQATLNWFATPPGEGQGNRGRDGNGRLIGPSSAHFVVATDGRIVQCVPLGRVAYHAGESKWMELPDVNVFSIGIELETDRGGRGPYTLPQMTAAADLCRWLGRRYGVKRENLVTHALVAWPPGRKVDPAGFPLEEFRGLVYAGPSRMPGSVLPGSLSRGPIRRPPGHGEIE